LERKLNVNISTIWDRPLNETKITKVSAKIKTGRLKITIMIMRMVINPRNRG
jgi:hypothetical protein